MRASFSPPRRTRIALQRTAGPVLLLLALIAPGLGAQTFTTEDPVLRQIWVEGMDRSQIYTLGQALLDSIGPRLTGSPGHLAASDWVRKTYGQWGIAASQEDYGTWLGWDRGRTHIDLVEPRIRTLEGTMLAWSGGTDGPTRGAAVVFPPVGSLSDLNAFLAGAAGKYVMLSPAEGTCRPTDHLREFATESTLEAVQADRQAVRAAWQARLEATGLSMTELALRLEAAGAAGILTSNWPDGWGVMRVFQSATRDIPTLALSCEDYGLVYRLADNEQGPVVEVDADAEFLGQVPAFNTIGRIEGTELPDEYIVLSAHFDSWDASSGATDNGTGTLTMMEAMRILKAAYPSPKRTILVGHWNGEEQGLNGSRAFAVDHPEVLDGMQALFNQDNGTGRVVRISLQGLVGAGAYFGKWLGSVPAELVAEIEVEDPGVPSGGGSDYASFICAGAPAFALGALSWEYSPYTWHTNRDTFDKVMIDDVKNNATLTAMLAYLASEELDRMPRERREMPLDPNTGQAREWPTCRDATRRPAERR